MKPPKLPLYLKELIVSYCPTRTLHSQNADLLVVPSASKYRMGGRAFSYHREDVMFMLVSLPQCLSSTPLQCKECATLTNFTLEMESAYVNKHPTQNRLNHKLHITTENKAFTS